MEYITAILIEYITAISNGVLEVYFTGLWFTAIISVFIIFFCNMNISANKRKQYFIMGLLPVLSWCGSMEIYKYWKYKKITFLSRHEIVVRLMIVSIIIFFISSVLLDNNEIKELIATFFYILLAIFLLLMFARLISKKSN